MKRIKNQGLTLVELLVSVAVLSIVTLGVGGLLRLAATQYSNATKETEVQNLTQTTVASITNAMEDAAIAVQFDSTNSILTIVNKEGYIKFQKVDSILYYDEGTFGSSTNTDDLKIAAATGAAVHTEDENRLCDYVSNFFVDTNSASSGIVVLNLTITFNDRVKAISQNVYLRNFHNTDSYLTTLNGPATTGPVTSGPVTTGPVTTGPVTTGPVTTGPVTTGPVTTGPVTTGPVTPPTGLPSGYTANTTPENNALKITVSDGSNTFTFRITKKPNGSLSATGFTEGTRWLLDDQHLDMPGFNWNNPDYTLSDEQIAWFNGIFEVNLSEIGSAVNPPDNPVTPGGDTPSITPTFVLDSTKPYSSMISEGDSGPNYITFHMNWYGSYLGLKVIKTATGYNLELSNTGQRWLLSDMNQGSYHYSKMPGLTDTGDTFTNISTETINWFKNNFGIDIIKMFTTT